MDQATATSLANEARQKAVKQAIAGLQGRIANASSLMAPLSDTLMDAQRQLSGKQIELSSLEAGAGPGVTDDWGDRETFVRAYLAKCQAAGLVTADTLASFEALIDT
jgi:ATP-dependent protease HslVU (ClpYQ) peptidase subunit